MTPEVLKPVLRDIHHFWFGELSSPDAFPEERKDLWFKQSDETDNAIRDRFGRFIPEAAAIGWNVAALTREEGVALLVLFDQFPRNIFRGSGEAFAYDARARETAHALLALDPRRYWWIERIFIGLPFEHSEDIDDQDYAVLYFAEFAVTTPADPAHKEYARVILDYATKHRDLIRRFGRFPHRNLPLGRQSTPEELAFLETGRGY